MRESKETRPRREANSLLHRIAHLPKNPYCQIWQETKCKSAQARRRDPQITHAPRRFGDLVLGDHLVMPREEHRGANGGTAGLILKDQGTGWRDCVATSYKGSSEPQRVMKEFADRHKITESFSDWQHSLATSHRPNSWSAIERELQLVLESSRCGLAASGMPLS